MVVFYFSTKQYSLKLVDMLNLASVVLHIEANQIM